MADFAGRIVIYGGKGALGNTLVKYFKSKNWWVGSVDLAASDDAHSSVAVNPKGSWAEQQGEVESGVSRMLQGAKANAIVCVAGGWAGGNIASSDVVKTADLMWKQSVWSSLIAAHLCPNFLEEGGLLVLTGASAALGPCHTMLGYGMAKAAVHELARSLGAPKSGMPVSSRCLAILPVTLDTPANRAAMPKASTSNWTSLDFVAELIHKWATEKDPALKSGSLVQLKTSNGKTELETCE